MRFFISLIFFISTLLAFDPSTLIKENKLVKSVYKIHELQLKAFDEHNINNDELMQQMLDNNTEVLRNTLLEIKSNPYTSSFIIENEYQKRVAFLKNRISLNIKRGNKYAVKRDELALAYLKELREINSFLMNVSKKVQEYPTHAEIKAFVLKTIKEQSSLPIGELIDPNWPRFCPDAKLDELMPLAAQKDVPFPVVGDGNRLLGFVDRASLMLALVDKEVKQ